MKFIHFILLSICLMACNSNDSDNSNSVQLKTSGLTGKVTIFESISENNYEISRDGNYDIVLPVNQTIYNLEVVDSGQQRCSISQQLDLVCNSVDCTTNYDPVCAKKPLAGVVCVTSPCPTDKYLTYGNSCGARSDNAWISLSSECGGLEDIITFHQKPVVIANFALLDIFTDDYQVIESKIVDDEILITFSVSGGCGSHDFTLYADEIFQESDPIALGNVIGYTKNDSCNNQIVFDKEFDLLPIKEIFQRVYPNQTGEQTVNLGDLGLYQFSIE